MESAFSKLKAVAHWNPKSYGAHILIFQTAQWNTSMCQISFLWVPFGLLPIGNGVWLCKEQVRHFLIISLACCEVIEKQSFKSWLLNEILRLLPHFLLIADQFHHYLVLEGLLSHMGSDRCVIYKERLLFLITYCSWINSEVNSELIWNKFSCFNMWNHSVYWVSNYIKRLRKI